MKLGMAGSPIFDYLLGFVGDEIDLLDELERYFWEEGK